jgi:hypothetical protein
MNSMRFAGLKPGAGACARTAALEGGFVGWRSHHGWSESMPKPLGEVTLEELRLRDIILAAVP